MFKIGDRVVCTKEYDDNEMIVNECGRIAANNGIEILVVFDDFVNGHSGWCEELGGDAAEDGYCWWVREDVLVLEDFTLENE